MVVDANGVFVTQRERPELALALPRIDDNALSFSAPRARALAVPVDARDERIQVEIFGEQYPTRTVSESGDVWSSQYLKAPHRLVAFDDAVLRKGGVQYQKRDDAPTLFPDNYGLLVLSDGSLADLNQRMPEPVPVNRFRPNESFPGSRPTRRTISPTSRLETRSFGLSIFAFAATSQRSIRTQPNPAKSRSGP
jgi:hypothetical protein